MSKQNPLINLALSSNALQQTLESLTIPLSKYPEVCGIDEAGRGCIAGSLFVCGVVLESLFKVFWRGLKILKSFPNLSEIL